MFVYKEYFWLEVFLTKYLSLNIWCKRIEFVYEVNAKDSFCDCPPQKQLFLLYFSFEIFPLRHFDSLIHLCSLLAYFLLI